MSPLAELLLALGYEVSGSDRARDAGRPPPHLAALERRGLRLAPQDGSGVAPGLLGVAVSTAIESDNPDLAAAGRFGVPVVHRARLLADLARGRTCVAVAGTAGKTTVTAMLGWLLEQAGLDPTVFAGGAVLNWVRPDSTGCVRVGRAGPWVLEVDESDRSLLEFRPDWAVITNISQDHFQLDEVERLFRQFAGQVGRGIVGCLGSPSNAELFEGLAPRLLRDGIRFMFRGREVRLGMLGVHNARNAIQALALAERLGADPAAAVRALAAFRGVARRLEIVGRAHGITVVDDYAHNPAKIRAGWEALAAGHARVLGVWRPHGFGPLALMADDLESVLAGIMRPDDALLLLPVYYAGGTANRTMTSNDFAARLARRGLRVEAMPDAVSVERAILERASPGEAVLVMGARDPDLPVLARRLADALAQAGPAARRSGSVCAKSS
jgi:UDP-N-acetylmuramate--alanine ligase